MKYFFLFSLVSLFSLNAFSLGETTSRDCCPLGTKCGGKVNCPGSDDRNSRKEVRQAKRKARRDARAAGKKI
jgi:hypothetical protein